jgi:hypothetical protein
MRSLPSDARDYRPSKRVVSYKLTAFAVLSAFLLLLHCPVFLSRMNQLSDWTVTVCLAYSVLMLADAFCEFFDESPPLWSNTILGFLLPVEPRGFPHLVALVALLSVLTLAIQIRGCHCDSASARQPQSADQPTQPR